MIGDGCAEGNVLPTVAAARADSWPNSEEEVSTAAASATDGTMVHVTAAERASLQLRVVLTVLRVAKRCVQPLPVDCGPHPHCRFDWHRGKWGGISPYYASTIPQMSYCATIQHNSRTTVWLLRVV